MKAIFGDTMELTSAMKDNIDFKAGNRVWVKVFGLGTVKEVLWKSPLDKERFFVIELDNPDVKGGVFPLSQIRHWFKVK